MLQIQNSTADWQDRLNDVPEGGANTFYGNWYARWGSAGASTPPLAVGSDQCREVAMQPVKIDRLGKQAGVQGKTAPRGNRLSRQAADHNDGHFGQSPGHIVALSLTPP